MLLVANKVDLLHSRKISEEKGKEIASQLGVEYIETSAKEPPLNIDTAFHQVINISSFNMTHFYWFYFV